MKIPIEELKEIGKVIQFCKSFNIEISKEMQGFLAGIQLSSEIPKLVPLEKYNELKQEKHNLEMKVRELEHTIIALNNKIRDYKPKTKGIFG